MPSKRKTSKKTNTNRKTAKRKTRSFKKRVNKKMTKKMKRIGKRLLKTKGIKVSRCSKKRLTSAKKHKLKKKKRSKRKRKAKGMPLELNIEDINLGNLATPEPTPTPPEDEECGIDFPTFNSDGEDITINVYNNVNDEEVTETVKKNKGLNFNELRRLFNNNNNNNNNILNRYRYHNGSVNKTRVEIINYNDCLLTFEDINDNDGIPYHVQPEDFICNYGEENQSFCYTHGHVDMSNENVDVYELP